MKTVNMIQRITTQRKKYITAVKLEICSLTRRIETTRKNRLRRANKRRKNMEYPKKIMSRSELMKMGFTEKYLIRAFVSPGQTFAWQDDPAVQNSKFFYDTEGLEDWRQKDIKLQQKARKQKVGVM